MDDHEFMIEHAGHGVGEEHHTSHIEKALFAVLGEGRCRSDIQPQSARFNKKTGQDVHIPKS